MSELDDIRARLEAVKDLDWDVWHSFGEEYYGDWVGIGPIQMIAAVDPSERSKRFAAEVQAEQVKQAALIDFLTHAAADIERLLTDRGAA